MVTTTKINTQKVFTGNTAIPSTEDKDQTTHKKISTFSQFKTVHVRDVYNSISTHQKREVK